MSDNSKHLWMGIGEKVISFVVGVILASFVLGGARQRVNTLGKEMDAWKLEWKERDKHITKMDLEGSVATKNFVHQYDKDQGKVHERLKLLEAEASHLDEYKLRIERLEKKNGADP